MRGQEKWNEALKNIMPRNALPVLVYFDQTYVTDTLG